MSNNVLTFEYLDSAKHLTEYWIHCRTFRDDENKLSDVLGRCRTFRDDVGHLGTMSDI